MPGLSDEHAGQIVERLDRIVEAVDRIAANTKPLLPIWLAVLLTIIGTVAVIATIMDHGKNFKKAYQGLWDDARRALVRGRRRAVEPDLEAVWPAEEADGDSSSVDNSPANVFHPYPLGAMALQPSDDWAADTSEGPRRRGGPQFVRLQGAPSSSGGQ